MAWQWQYKSELTEALEQTLKSLCATARATRNDVMTGRVILAKARAGIVVDLSKELYKITKKIVELTPDMDPEDALLMEESERKARRHRR